MADLYTTIRPFLVFLVRFSCSHFPSAENRNRTVSFFAPKGLRIIAQGCREAATLGKHNPT
ncbi:MAG: hypothetical protein BECKG1743E_GA0114224_105781, partial [Candidatus Kentron sp. G]